MSDIVDTSPLGIERTERIAGDDALNSRLDTVTTELQGTQASVTTEVLHRSEGDLVIQRVIEGYIQDLLEGKAEDFERYIEFQNSQNLNYADVRNFVSGIRTSLADDIRDLSTSLMNNLQANDARYDKLVSDVGRYLEILSDITLDSNQITLDNGELRAGAWTILSQARAWDLEIISRLNGLSESVGDSLKDAVEEIQNQLPSTEETITKAIEELSKSPLIKELSDLLNQSIENDIAYELALLEQARKHANEMSQLAEDMRAEALAKAQEMEDYMAGEVTARITEVNKEVAARKEAIDVLTEDMLTRVDQDKADYQADMLAAVNRIKSAEDGLTSEIQHRKDGDTSTLNALNTYKVSNDTAITGLTTSLSNNVTKTSANTTLITGLTSRLETAEDGIDSATTAAADAMSKATTAVTANSALATRVDALAASITESDGTVVDVNAFNALKAEVTTVKGAVTGLVEDITALETNYTSVNNKVTTQGTAISTLNTKMSTAENSISQSANDITLLKTDINKVNAGLLTKVDSQAFSQLSSDVTELDDKYTTQASLVTDLRGSLDTTNVNVGNAASAAQNALTAAGSKGKVIFGTSAPATADRLSQNLWIDTTGGANTPKRWNGSTWVVVTDKVATDALAAANAATILVNTKADTSAFNSLDQKVTVMDGKVSTNTNSITSLSGKIDIVEGGLATKLDSSALVNYYTKQQADENALSTAAGEISKFSADLRVGGVNLADGYEDGNRFTGYTFQGSRITVTARPELKDEMVSASDPFEVVSTGGTSTLKSTPALTAYKDAIVVITFKVKNLATTPLRINFNGLGSQKIIKGGDLSNIAPNIIQEFEVTGRLRPDYDWAQFQLNSSVAGNNLKVVIADVQFEVGNKATSWKPPAYLTQQALDANATAIQNTNAEVLKVDGKTVTNANNITGLTSRMGNVEGKVSTKADASALQNYYTKTEADTNATTVAAGEVSKYNASLVIGGTNLININEVKNLALSSTVVGGSTYRGFILPVNEGEVYSISRPLIESNRFRYTFTKVLPANGVPFFGGTGNSATYDNALKIENIVIPAEAAYLFIYTSNAGETVTKIKAEKGSKASDWSPSTSDVQNQIDVNATAIETTNTEVSRVDGRVTTEANRITTLSGRVSTVEGGLTTKANVSALNALTTRVGTVEGGLSTQANNTTKLEAKIDSRSNEFSLAHDYDTKNPAEWVSHYSDRDLSIHFKTVTDGKIGNSVFRKDTTHASTNYNYNLSDVPNDRAYRLTMWVRCSADSTGSVGFNYRYTTDASPEFTTAYSSVPGSGGGVIKDGTWQLITIIADFRTSAFNRLRFGFYMGHSGTAGWWEMQGFKVEAVVGSDDVDGTLATTTALSSTNSEVSRINGVVEGHSTDLTNLTASISGKADASALNSLTARVEAEEGKTSSQATSITNLTSSLSDTDKLAKDALPKIGGGGSFKTFKEVLNYYHASSSSSANIVIETPITYSANMFRISGKGYNYASTKSVIDFDVSGYAYQNTGTILQHGAKNNGTFPMRIRLGMKDGKLCVILSPKGTNFAYPAFTLDATVSYGSVSDVYQTGWTGSQITEANLASSGITNIIEPSLLDVAEEVTATASALSTLDTKVEEVDGIVTTQANQLIVLTSDNNANKNALTVQGKVIDGVKSSYMVKMETNGVIGGFGLMQSTGVLGQVVTSFGVNADAFFIGAPASKKKPFIVTTTNQVVNGVTYPAGTYIDVALIANATIGTAHIANASITNAKIANIDAAKITTGTLDAGRIRVGSSTQFDNGFAPADVLNNAKTYVDDNTGNLLNNTTVSGTRDKWSSVATVTDQDFFGKTVPVLTLSGTTNMGANSAKFKVDPSKAYEVSFWAKADIALGTMYFGAIGYNSAGSNIGFNGIAVSTGNESTAVNTNLYFWSGSNASLPVGEWRKYTAYIMPVGTPGPSMKGLGDTVTTNARFLPDTSDIIIRWFNYTTAGQSTKWAANFKCVEVDPNTIIAAKAAQVLADSKTQTFTAQPTTPYASGDIYRNGSSIYVCTTARTSGSYVASDWTLVGDVTANNTAADANKLGGTAASTVVNNAAKGIAVYNDVMSDLKITPVEKTSLNTEWIRIKAEYASMIAHAASLSVSTTAFTTAYNALNSTSPTMTSILSSMVTTTALTAAQRDALRTQFTNYYAQVTSLNKSISDKVAANAKAEVDNLVIGGTNLVLDSNKVVQNNNGPSFTITMNTTGDVYKFTNTGSTPGISTYTAQFIETEIGKEYTVSLKVKASKSCSLQLYASEVTSKSATLIPANSWVTIWVTFKATAVSTRLPGLVTGGDSVGLPVGTIVEYKEYKFEEGTKVTTWAPNAKDLEAQIATKAQTFTTTPTTPYTSGDIFRNGSAIYVCTNPRASGSYAASDWTLVGDVTANNKAADTAKVNGVSAATVVSNAANGAAVYSDVMSDLKITPVEKTAINQEWNRIQKEYASLLAQAQALSLTTTTFTSAYTGLSTTAPAMSTILASMSTTTTLTAAQRDAYKTQYTTYYTQAVAITKAINDKIAANAKAQADAKSKTFTSQPVTPYTAGDLWRNGSTIRVCTVSRTSGSYVAADWTLVGDVTSANTAANANQLGGRASATVLSDITSAKSVADAATNQLALWKFPNTTEIDGGKIRTNTVTANQINVANLSAISANLGTIKVGTANIADLAVGTNNIKINSVTEFNSISISKTSLTDLSKTVFTETLNFTATSTGSAYILITVTVLGGVSSNSSYSSKLKLMSTLEYGSDNWLFNDDMMSSIGLDAVHVLSSIKWIPEGMTNIDVGVQIKLNSVGLSQFGSRGYTIKGTLLKGYR